MFSLPLLLLGRLLGLLGGGGGSGGGGGASVFVLLFGRHDLGLVLWPERS